MRRSEVNRLIAESIRFIDGMNHQMPEWARWSPADWKGRGPSCREIVDNGLGWDLTDFGSGDFPKCGLILVTLRNGSAKDPRYPKKYAEKFLVVGEGQVTPIHFHWSKMEDIINRGGGNLVIHLWNATADEKLDTSDVLVSIDGVQTRLAAGEAFALRPGQSVCFVQRVYHKFYGEPGKGPVLVGEVSTVNDDSGDNRFLERNPRFPALEEDEPIRYPLFSEIAACF